MDQQRMPLTMEVLECYLNSPTRPQPPSAYPQGHIANNYDSEVWAIEAAVQELTSSNLETQSVVFLTDAKSVLEALQAGKLPELIEALSGVSKQNRITLQWIPSHCGVPGNETADRLAKQGSSMQQPDVPMTYSRKKNLIKTIRRPSTTSRDDYHLLNRQEQVTIFRLRTGHNRLRNHMFSKFKIGETALCTCGQEPQTTEHVLQTCPGLDTLRNTHWPTETPLRVKLYGCMEELQRTVSFIQDTALQI